MMDLPAIKLDTLSIVKELEDSGMPKHQAEFQVRATVKAINMVIEEKLVTKQDLAASEKCLSEDIAGLDKRIIVIEEKMATKQDLAETEKRLSGNIHDLEKAMNEQDKCLTGAINDLDKRITLLDHRIEKLQLILTVRLGGIMVAAMMALGAILKF
jgi:predicted  nucleic acid-binding Zn-ribbon protein